MTQYKQPAGELPFCLLAAAALLPPVACAFTPPLAATAVAPGGPFLLSPCCCMPASCSPASFVRPWAAEDTESVVAASCVLPTPATGCILPPWP